MFLSLNHQKRRLYFRSRQLVKDCYLLTRHFPGEERFALTVQIRRAAVSVHLDIAEGASRFSSQERRRFFEIARGSLIEIDAALDLASELGFLQNQPLATLQGRIVECFKTLSGLINSLQK